MSDIRWSVFIIDCGVTVIMSREESVMLLTPLFTSGREMLRAAQQD